MGEILQVPLAPLLLTRLYVVFYFTFINIFRNRDVQSARHNNVEINVDF